MLKRISYLLIGTGAILLFTVVFSIFTFTSPPNIIDPVLEPKPKNWLTLKLKTLDYNQADNWFIDSPAIVASSSSSVKFFTLSIPRLKLQDVSVEVDGADLSKNAIKFKGTALPGDYGNSVIFGHSSLPQFYKSGSPKTIFNPLPKSKVGDEVIVNFDGIQHRYVIKKTFEVKAEDAQVLAQQYDKKRLTLITCVPLGTYWRRFVAVAELVN